MKKFTYLICGVIILFLFSCGQNSFEKQLNGKWYELETGGAVRLNFFEDSLIITDTRIQSVDWSANESVIEFDYQLLFADTLGRKMIPTKLKYKLSATKDTLFTQILDYQEKRSLNLLRADNYIDYLNKKTGIKFDLPNSDTIESLDLDTFFGFKIYLGMSDGIINGKTIFSNDLTSLESDIRSFRDSVIIGRPENYWLNEKRFHLKVFADKKIPDSLITSVLRLNLHSELYKKAENYRPPYDTLPIKLYRMYQSPEYENLGFMNATEIESKTNLIFIK